jgi:hypothetical protein
MVHHRSRRLPSCTHKDHRPAEASQCLGRAKAQRVSSTPHLATYRNHRVLSQVLACGLARPTPARRVTVHAGTSSLDSPRVGWHNDKNGPR